MIQRFRSALLVLFLLCVPALAHADYQTEKDNKNLDVIDRALKKYAPDPAIFDGKKIAPNTSPDAITAHFKTCNEGPASFNKYFPRVSAKNKNSPRAQQLSKLAQERQKWCMTLATVGDAYIKKVRDAQNAAAAAAEANKEMCFKLYREVSKTLPSSEMFDTLDTARGARTMVAREDIGEFRKRLDKLAGVCTKTEYKSAQTSCKGIGIVMSSATNARYDYSDLCAPAADVQKTITEAAMRSLEHFSEDHQRAPDLRAFRLRKGWLRSEQAFTYDSFFTVNDKTRERLLSQATELFAGAGVPVPSDLSGLWKKKQDYLNEMKTLVDTTVGEWKITNYDRCKGYPCNLAKKSLLKGYKGAKIKSIFGSNDWKIHKNGLGVPLDRTVSVTIVFQVKGDPSCQARSFTATEVYKGGGKYKKTKGVNWGYGRFQKCQ